MAQPNPVPAPTRSIAVVLAIVGLVWLAFLGLGPRLSFLRFLTDGQAVLVLFALLVGTFSSGFALMWIVLHGDRIPENRRRVALAFIIALLYVVVISPTADVIASVLGADRSPLLDIRFGALTELALFPMIGGHFLLAAQFLGRTPNPFLRVLYLVLPAIPMTLLVQQLVLPLEFSNVAQLMAITILGVSVLVAGEWIIRSLERDKELGLGGQPSNEDLDARFRHYETKNQTSVGISLSGGGYRASIFGLGALMYINDALADSRMKSRRLLSISSVSGGSLTNAFLGHAVEIGNVTPTDFDVAAKRLIGQLCTETGSMFGGTRAKIYYRLLLPVAGLALVTFIWWSFRYMSWSTAWRIITLLAAGPLSYLLVDRSTRRIHAPLRGTVTAIWLLALLAGALFALSANTWRLAVGWFGLGVFMLFALSVVWNMRGDLVQGTFDRILASIGSSTRLRDLSHSVHHVFCATEMQAQESVYMTPEVILSRSFPGQNPGNIATARAVRASAALPFAFPPVLLRNISRSHRGVDPRVVGEQPQFETPAQMILVDGGVRDNLGVEWFEEFNLPIDELIVVSGAANRRVLSKAPLWSALREIFALARFMVLPYDVKERNRRRAFVASMTRGQRHGDGPRGALIHIEDSPLDLVRLIEAQAYREGEPFKGRRVGLFDWEQDQLLLAEALWEAAASDVAQLAARANAARERLESMSELPGLPVSSDKGLRIRAALAARSMRLKYPALAGDLEIRWFKVASKSASTSTTLNRMTRENATNLLVHGYCLAMTTLHVTFNWPLLESFDEARLGNFFSGIPLTLDSLPSPTDRFHALQQTSLQSAYSLMVLMSVSQDVRTGADAEYRQFIVALGLQRGGQLDLMGLWPVPAWAHAPQFEPRDLRRTSRELKRQIVEFWPTVFRNMTDRGVEKVAFCVSPIVRDSDRNLSPNEFVGCDEAIRAVFPMTYHTSSNVKDSIIRSVSLTLSWDDRKLMDSELHDILQEADISVARTKFDRFVAEWRDSYPAIAEEASANWNAIAGSFGIPKTIREFIREVEERVDEIEWTLREPEDRGAAPTEEVALAEICQGLQEAIGHWKRLRGRPSVRKLIDQQLGAGR